MRVLVVVQARLTSSRLPAKAMLALAGRPMVVLAAQRAANAGAEVVVATSDGPDDDVIVAAVESAGLTAVRGPLDDPLRRFTLAAAELAPDDVVVRLTADNVVPDGALVRWLVDAMGSAGAAYARLGGDDPTLPYGVAAEVFTVDVLRATDELATDPVHREHVTGLMRERHGDLRLPVPEASLRDWSGRRCTVDGLDDYVAVAGLLAGATDPVGEPWWQLCDRLAGGPPPAAPTNNPTGQGRLVLGTVQLGVDYGVANHTGLPDDASARTILLAARDQGVTHLDTARAYGVSEARIGAALARGLHEHLGVVTKLRPLDDVPMDADPAWGRAAALESVQRSLRELRVSHVDALLVHRADDWERPGVRDVLLDARADGTTALVGASVSSPDELARVLADPQCGYVQLPFNLLDRRWKDDEVVRMWDARADVIATVRSVFLQGLLVGGPEVRWPSGAAAVGSVVRDGIDDLVRRLDRASPADLCVAYVLGHLWVTSIVVGADCAEQVVEVADLVRRRPLTAAEIATVQQVIPAGGHELIDPSRWRQG